MQKLATEEGVSYDKYMDDVPKKLRIQRLGEPSDVAELVTFLSTEETRWIHGTIVDVDGGQNKGI
jgi:NAD(P)-dependent dehydrogenase (short-subunit alcohol dehydrogenase family)